jgi:hypothetical protein
MPKCGIHVFDIFTIMNNISYVFNHLYSYKIKSCHEIHNHMTKARDWLQKHVWPTNKM